MNQRSICFVLTFIVTSEGLTADLIFLQQPQPVTVLQGQPATFSVVVTGTPPIAYRWIRGGVPYVTSSVPVLVLTNNQTNVSIRVAATNITTGPGGLNSSTAQLIVVPDADGDSIPDAWELLHGLVPVDAEDASLDFDLDGMSNLDEYRAGTDPNDPLSVLKLIIAADNRGALQFVAQTNKSYAVQYRTGLVFSGWSNFVSFSPLGSIRTTRVEVPNPPAEPARFYRVVTPMVP